MSEVVSSSKQKKMSEEWKFWQRFLTGFAGGLTPYALGFAAFCLSAPPLEALPGLFTMVMSIIGVMLFSAIGGVLSAIWDRKEKELKRLFFIGMAAPSIIVSMLNNIEQGAEKSKHIPKTKPATTISSYRTAALKVSPQAYQDLVIHRITFLRNISFPHRRDDIVSKSKNPPTYFSIDTSEKPSAILDLHRVTNRVFEVTNRMFNTMFRAVGLNEFHTIPLLIIVFIAILLIYRARMQARLVEANNVFREELSKTNPNFKILQEKIKDTGLTIEQAITLLGKGNLVERGLSALGKKNFDEAINQFTDAMREISDVFFYRASAYFDRGDYGKAVEDLDKFLELDPTDATAWTARGVALERLERYAESLSSHDKALELEPTNATAWYNRGVALERLERYAESLSSYDKALELDPTDASVLNNYAWILIDKDIDIDKGIEKVKKALELSPDDSSFKDTLAWGFYRKGKYQEAFELLKEATNGASDDEEIKQHLEEVKANLTEE